MWQCQGERVRAGEGEGHGNATWKLAGLVHWQPEGTSILVGGSALVGFHSASPFSFSLDWDAVAFYTTLLYIAPCLLLTVALGGLGLAMEDGFQKREMVEWQCFLTQLIITPLSPLGTWGK